MRELSARALALGIPLSVHVDLTYRCNERCVHCYLDHDDHGEMDFADVASLLDQLAGAGTLFLVLSGGEIFLRRDLLAIVEHARRRRFSTTLKTNAVLVDDARASRLAELGVAAVHVSVYSHRRDVHDAITNLPGSFDRTMSGIGRLIEKGLRVVISNVLMAQNAGDYHDVKRLAEALGAAYRIDPTITPMLDGGRAPTALNVGTEQLRGILRDPGLTESADGACPPDAEGAGLADALDALPCSAGHTSCYVSPSGDVCPCVQFPMAAGNVRHAPFLDIWRHSPGLSKVRAVTMQDVRVCSACAVAGTCTRCPGLAYMEGDLRGPSRQDCEKSLARTGVIPLPLVR